MTGFCPVNAFQCRRQSGSFWSIGIAACLLLVSISFSSALHARTENEEWDYEAFSEAVSELEQKLGQVRSAIDQTRFDADELVFELAFEGNEIVRFVTEKVAFHPYEGLLRGLRGTLQSRSGNSLDQALLLAYLLKTAGLDARVVHGELALDEAAELLQKTSAPPGEASLATLEKAVQKHFGPQALERAETVELDQTRLAARTRTTFEWLIEHLSNSGHLPEADALNKRLVEQLRTYFWAEYRDAPGQKWQAAHPAWGEAPDLDLEPLEYMAEKIPEAYHHQLTVQAFIRQRQLDTFKTHELMSAYRRPVANLHGVVIRYQNYPSGLNPDVLTDLEQALGEDTVLTPMFRGAPAPGMMAFDLKGRAIDPMVVGPEAGGAAGLFAELSDKMEAATGTMADRDDPKTVFELDSMWLEFTWTSPSGVKAVQRRYLLPPGHGAERPPAELLWPLISEYVYVVNAGTLPLAYIADRYLETGQASLEVFRALGHKMMRPDEGTPLPKTDVPQDFGPLALYRIMASNPLSDAAIRVRHRPALVGLRNGFRDAHTAFSAVDVVFNQALYMDREAGELRHDPSVALRQGIWETAVEMVPGMLRGDQVIDRHNAFEVFDRARKQGIAVKTLVPGPSALEEMDVDMAAREWLRGELESGFVVIAPVRQPEGLDMTGWWRVDPVTGNVLGMTADGHGQDVVEYLIDTTGIAFNLVQALGNLLECEKKTDRVEKMCCLVQAHINNVGGLAMGGLMGATVGSAGAALFDIVNFGTELATEAAFGEKKGIMPSLDLSCEKMRGMGF